MKTNLFFIVAVFSFLSSSSAQFSFWELESEILNQDSDFMAVDVNISNEYAFVSGHNFEEKTGAVAVFRLVNENWEDLGIIQASDGQPDDGFGRGISVDGNTLLVGSPSNPFESYNVGKAYVFELEDGFFVEKSILAPALNNPSAIGLTTDIEGDLAVIGGPASIGMDDSGIAVCYQRVNDVWQEIQQLTPPVVDNASSFGSGISISEDWLAVSSYMLGGGLRHVVYLYQFVDGSWEFRKRIDAPGSYLVATIPSSSVALNGEDMLFGYRHPFFNDNNYGGAKFYKRNQSDEWESSGQLNPVGLNKLFLGRQTKMDSEFALLGYSEEPAVDFDSAHQVLFYQRDLSQSWSEIGRFPLLSGSAINSAGPSFGVTEMFAILGNASAVNNEGRAYVVDLRSFIIQTSVSTEPTFAECKLFPNPAVDQLNISTEKQMKRVLIFDESGRVVLEKTGIQNTGLEIDVSAFSSGMYCVQIILESGRGEVRQIMVGRK